MRHTSGMPFLLPVALRATDDTLAINLLQQYYEPPAGSAGWYTGSAFDNWDSTGTRARDVDVFTADDLVAVTFLSVTVSVRATHALLVERRDQFTGLLSAVGPDRDLVDEADPFADDSAEWRLMGALRELPGVGPTIASKLLARKRPRLRPIYDSVVARVTDTRTRQWEQTRVALRANEGSLHKKLLRLRGEARLTSTVSPLRILDVIAWMEGKLQH